MIENRRSGSEINYKIKYTEKQIIIECSDQIEYFISYLRELLASKSPDIDKVQINVKSKQIKLIRRDD